MAEIGVNDRNNDTNYTCLTIHECG